MSFPEVFNFFGTFRQGGGCPLIMIFFLKPTYYDILKKGSITGFAQFGIFSVFQHFWFFSITSFKNNKNVYYNFMLSAGQRSRSSS